MFYNMRDLSLHIMDIVENSIRAGAANVVIRILEDPERHTLDLVIEDDGGGLKGERDTRAVNPFYTTKEGKRFGLGLSLLSQATEAVGGSMQVINKKGKGVTVKATFHTDHVDMKPHGDINKTLRVLRGLNPDIHFDYQHEVIKRKEASRG